MYWLPYATNMKRAPGKPGGSLIKWCVLCACTGLVRRVVVVVVASPRKDRDTGAHLSCTRENGCSTARATQLRCTSPIRQPKQGPRDLYLSTYVHTQNFGRYQYPIPSLPSASVFQAFARAKDREKARAQAATALMAGAENGGGEDDMGRALAAGGSGSGGAAVATVLGHGPQTPMRQVGDGVFLLWACP